MSNETSLHPMHLWANVHNVSATPHYRNMRVSNVDDSFHNHVGSLSGYEELFGGLGHCECEECRSIFGPAAYFVELMRVVDETSSKNQIPEMYKLEKRRPDLYALKLTCENTNKPVSYLEIVNQVLTLRINASADEAYKTLASTKHPFNLPFNRPLEQIRAYLRTAKTDLATVYKTFHVDEKEVARESLGLSVEEYARITTSQTGKEKLLEIYGLDASVDPIVTLSDKNTFCRQTGLSEMELRDLFYRNLNESELKNLAHDFYINQKINEKKHLSLDGNEIKNLDLVSLDRIHRFVRLVKKINWSFADLDWVLNSIKAEEINEAAINNVAKIRMLQTKFNMHLDILCSLLGSMKASDKGGETSTKLATLLKLPVSEYLLLVEMIKKEQGTLDVADVIEIVAAADWIRIAGFNVYELHYILNGHDERYVPNGKWDEAVEGFLKGLRASNIAKRHDFELKADDVLDWDSFISEAQEYIRKLDFSNAKLDNLKRDLDRVKERNNYRVSANDVVIYDQLSLDWLKDLVPAELPSTKPEQRAELARKYNAVLELPNFYEELHRINAKGSFDFTTVSLIAKLLIDTKDLRSKKFDSLTESQKMEIIKLNRLIIESHTQGVLVSKKKIDQEVRDFMLAVIKYFNGIYEDKAVDISPTIIESIKKTNPNLVVEIERETAKTASQNSKLKRLLLEAIFPNGIAKSNIKHIGDEWREGLIQNLAKLLHSTTDEIGTLAELMARIKQESKINYVDAFLNDEKKNDDYLKDFLQKLYQWLILTRKLQLTPVEINAIRRYPERFGIVENFALSVHSIQTLSAFKRLVKGFDDTEGKLLAFVVNTGTSNLPSAINTTYAEKLSQISPWQDQQLKALIGHFTDSKYQSKNPLNVVEWLAKLKECIDLAKSLGADITFCLDLLALADKNSQKHWKTYTAVAASVIGMAKSRCTDSEWEQLSQKIDGSVNELSRTAVGKHVLSELRKGAGVDKAHMDNLRHLSEYLLIDVEMSACASASYIQQAILSLQTYLQRCRMNLEPGINQLDIPDAQWDLLMDYRKWEASRKVFLYPENYLADAPRKWRTDLFREFEESLLQTNITQETVEAAYHKYLDGLLELSNLRIVETYRCYIRRNPNDASDVTDTLFIFGRTATEPYIYYYRGCIEPTSQHPTWEPWSKIEVSIKADTVSPVFVFNKLFVFWVETTKITDTDNDESGKTKKTTKETATIKYTYHTLSGKWVQPQTVSKDIGVVGVNDSSTSSILINNSNVSLLNRTSKVHLIAMPAEASNRAKIICMLDGTTGFVPQFPDVPGNESNLLAYLRHVPDASYMANTFETSKGALLTEDLITENPSISGRIACFENSRRNFQFKKNISLNTVKNQPGWFMLDTGEDAFLLMPEIEDKVQPSSENLILADNGQLSCDDKATELKTAKFRATRLTTVVVRELAQMAFIGGVDYLLTPDFQFTPELDFQRLNLGTDGFVPPASDILDFKGAYGDYFREIFFHVPFLVANTLSTHRQFEGARQWYHYIFNPGGNSEIDWEVVKELGYWRADGKGKSIFHDAIGGNNVRKIDVVNVEIKLGVHDFPARASTDVLHFKGNGYAKTQRKDRLHKENRIRIDVWVKLADVESNQKILGNATAGLPSGFVVGVQSAKIDVEFWDRKNTRTAVKGGKIEKNKWIHISVTWHQGGYVVGYVNDIEVGRAKATDLPLGGGDQIVFGAAPWATDQFRLIAGSQIAQVSIGRCRLKPTVWRYRPFCNHELETLQQMLSDESAIRAHNSDPFNPHAVAHLRIGAYEKAVAMKYIDNLLAWGDSCFAKDTWESITQASTLYMLAYDLLGHKPESKGSCKAPVDKTYRELTSGKSKELRTACGSHGKLKEVIFALEKDKALAPLESFLDDTDYFCVPENEQFTGYWKKVEDQLFKIRHCLNIKGVIRELALFEPPLNPAELVRAVTAGGAALGAFATPQFPHYRFEYLLERARNITAMVIQLGASLLSVLEKKDAEALATMRAGQEPALLNLIKMVREQQTREAEAYRESLEKGLEAAKQRTGYYQDLMSKGLSVGETVGIALRSAATRLETQAAGANYLSAPLYWMPNVFGLANGGHSPASALQAIAAGDSSAAGVLNNLASSAEVLAQYERRRQEWQQQLQTAQDDVEMVNRQIRAAEISVAIAQSELRTHEKSVEQSQEVYDFLKTKFTKADLYQWMAGRLSLIYFETYKISLEMALLAQKAYQFEMNVEDESYIVFNHWDGLKEGLLGGEGLMLCLNQLEKAHIENNVRRLEIEKTISVRKLLNASEFENGKRKGQWEFELKEEDFNKDFPNHYCRRIKTLSVTIPAVTGPYENINAMLIQTTNSVRIKRDDKNLRQDWRSRQKIALSRGVSDNGMFELNFRDERYLPFEGTGTISKWELQLHIPENNKNLYDNLTDIIIRLNYTALDGG